MLKKAIVCGIVAGVSLAGVSLGFSLSAQAAMLRIGHSDQYGDHLTDGNGRALYLFTGDTQGTPHGKAKVSCINKDCMTAWPPLYEGSKLDADKDTVDTYRIDTVKLNDERVVTYNGWPLHYSQASAGAGEPKGNAVKDFGGEWYLLDPSGNKISKK